MMHHKALLFNDLPSAAAVLKAAHPRKAKTLGRAVANFDEATWAAARLQIVHDANVGKFTRAVSEQGLCRGSGGQGHPVATSGGSLRALLLATGERELVEASPFDRIWGVGFRPADAPYFRDEWGLNLLGQALMAVRTELRAAEEGGRAEGTPVEDQKVVEGA